MFSFFRELKSPFFNGHIEVDKVIFVILVILLGIDLARSCLCNNNIGSFHVADKDMFLSCG